MSDLMLYGVLEMPYEMAMSGEISRRQFWGRAQEAAKRLKAAEARLAELDRAPVSTPQQSAQRASVDTPAVQQQAEPDPNRDPLYDKAVAVVRVHQRASLSLVQRTLLIGYNRTARLFEAMEKAGVVSPFDENGHRTVLPAAPSPAPQGEQA